jgi:hypothetical protein
MRTLAAFAALTVAAPVFADGLTATKSKDGVEFKDGDKLVTKYLTGPDVPKPHLWPLHAPDGTPVTAHSPADHKHHKSVWFCHGDVIPDGVELKTKSSDKRVAGVDFWSEHEGYGKIVCVEVGEPKVDGKTVSVPTRNEWRTPDGVKILDESRTITLTKLDKGYLIAFDIDLHASVCGVTFGDTKEGSFGTRVNEQIGTAKKFTGTLTADHDRTGEKPIWGQPIDWMDYSGTVDGKAVGLAVFDHPKNPVRAISHGRAYGLVAANPFGRDKSFPSQKGKTDLVKLAKGEHLKLKYAAFAHTGDAKSGGVAEAYQAFGK